MKLVNAGLPYKGFTGAHNQKVKLPVFENSLANPAGYISKLIELAGW